MIQEEPRILQPDLGKRPDDPFLLLGDRLVCLPERKPPGPLPSLLLPSCKDNEHLGRLFRVPGEEGSDPQVNGNGGKGTAEGIRVDIPLAVKVTPFKDQDWPERMPCQSLELPKQVPLNERIDKVPGGLPFHHDAVPCQVIAVGEPLHGKGCTKRMQVFHHLRGGLPVVHDDCGTLRHELADPLLDRPFPRLFCLVLPGPCLHPGTQRPDPADHRTLA